MKTVDIAVTSRLRADGGNEDAAKLWKALWAAYESGGAVSAKAHLSALCELPADSADDLEDEVES